MDFEFKAFRKVVENIIEQHKGSISDFFSKENDMIRIEKENFLPFVIEKVQDTLLVGFYRKQGGDWISDPVFVFHLMNGCWLPIRLEQWIGDTMLGLMEDGQYKWNKRAMKSAKSFATDCSKEWKAYFLEKEC
ncbi:DUF6908 domain-containing protein [Bacillus sp. NPDC094106]|uniref:DUF6908 domain-containing protein n=1 Tax=Bacillus sp. NPDC094106 TaxID=3363949 RepID=UPI0037F9BDE3